MHYTIDYSKLSEPEKSEAALRDLKKVLSRGQWAALSHALETQGKTWTRNAAHMLLGISGFPIEAFINKYSTEGTKE